MTVPLGLTPTAPPPQGGESTITFRRPGKAMGERSPNRAVSLEAKDSGR